jgi:hypothetical protein
MFKILLLASVSVITSYGQTLYCLDALGTPVGIVNTSMPDIGAASIYLGRPVIFFNATLAQAVPPNVATFFLYHECGHHALGHTLGIGYPPANEQAADCWAAQMLVRSGQFGDQDIRAVQAAIANFGRADSSHLPGPIRAINLGACLFPSGRY